MDGEALVGYSPRGHKESDTTEATSLSVLLGHKAKSETSLAIQWLNLHDFNAGFNPWVGNIPWRRKWQPTPVFLPGESHGRRSLVGYSPWGRKSRTRVSDFTFTFKESVKTEVG